MSTSPQTADEQTLDRVFRALGDPTRRALLSRLADGPTTVSDLAEPFDMSLPAVSKHLRVLEHAGLLERRIDGRVHHCALSAEPLLDAQSFIRQYTEFWTESLSNLGRHFQVAKPDDA